MRDSSSPKELNEPELPKCSGPTCSDKRESCRSEDKKQHTAKNKLMSCHPSGAPNRPAASKTHYPIYHLPALIPAAGSSNTNAEKESQGDLTDSPGSLSLPLL